jgi:hypothetical protein
MNNGGTLSLGIRSEKDRRSEDPLEGCDQAAVLRTALLHAEGIADSGAIGPLIPVGSGPRFRWELVQSSGGKWSSFSR